MYVCTTNYIFKYLIICLIIVNSKDKKKKQQNY